MSLAARMPLHVPALCVLGCATFALILLVHLYCQRVHLGAVAAELRLDPSPAEHWVTGAGVLIVVCTVLLRFCTSIV